MGFCILQLSLTRACIVIPLRACLLAQKAKGHNVWSKYACVVLMLPPLTFSVHEQNLSTYARKIIAHA